MQMIKNYLLMFSLLMFFSCGGGGGYQDELERGIQEQVKAEVLEEERPIETATNNPPVELTLEAKAYARGDIDLNLLRGENLDDDTLELLVDYLPLPRVGKEKLDPYGKCIWKTFETYTPSIDAIHLEDGKTKLTHIERGFKDEGVVVNRYFGYSSEDKMILLVREMGAPKVVTISAGLRQEKNDVFAYNINFILCVQNYKRDNMNEERILFDDAQFQVYRENFNFSAIWREELENSEGYFSGPEYLESSIILDQNSNEACPKVLSARTIREKVEQVHNPWTVWLSKEDKISLPYPLTVDEILEIKRREGKGSSRGLTNSVESLFKIKVNEFSDPIAGVDIKGRVIRITPTDFLCPKNLLTTN